MSNSLIQNLFQDAFPGAAEFLIVYLNYGAANGDAFLLDGGQLIAIEGEGLKAAEDDSPLLGGDGLDASTCGEAFDPDSIKEVIDLLRHRPEAIAVGPGDIVKAVSDIRSGELAVELES